MSYATMWACICCKWQMFNRWNLVFNTGKKLECFVLSFHSKTGLRRNSFCDSKQATVVPSEGQSFRRFKETFQAFRQQQLKTQSQVVTIESIRTLFNLDLHLHWAQTEDNIALHFQVGIVGKTSFVLCLLVPSNCKLY